MYNNYAFINLKNIEDNVSNLISNYNDYNYYFGVVKGNAYGHGYKIVKTLIKSGINYLAVATYDEAILVRNEDLLIPILIMQPIEIEEIEGCIKNNFTITIHSLNYFEKIINLELTDSLKFHLKINTGMNRLGVDNESEILEIYNSTINSNLIFEGLYSHFQTPGINDKIWDNQYNKFIELTKSIDLSKIKIVHMGRSLTLINHPKIDFCNGVRIGIAMFGQDLTPKPGSSLKEKIKKIRNFILKKIKKISPTTLNCKIDLKPTLYLYSKVIQVRNIKKNDFVGYGTSFKAKENMKIAIIAIGYGSGIFRKSRGRFIKINNKKYKIIGDICMGMIFAQVDDQVIEGSKVTLIDNELSLKYVSRHIGTTPYEVLTNLKVPLIYGEGE